MSTRHLVDPELLPALDLFSNMQKAPADLAALRAFVLSMAPVPIEQHLIRHTSADDGHSIRMVLNTPPAHSAAGNAGLPAILHIHGGGYIAGAPEMSHERNRQLAAALGVVVLAVAYRLAPEHPHPTPVEDCYAALAWLHRNAANLGVDPTRIAVMGESAGGGLAASLALLARDRGEFPISFQLLIYPMLDDRTAAAAPANPYVGEFAWTNKDNFFGWKSLLGCPPGSAEIPPYASPARHEQLENLPPTFIATGALDLFLDEDIIFAQRLARAGVPIELHVYPGAFHGFDVAADTRLGKALKRDIETALGRALNG